MKRTFADLHLRVNPKDQAATQTILTKQPCLGYKLVALSLPLDMRGEEIAA
jgi:hypothetical protein